MKSLLTFACLGPDVVNCAWKLYNQLKKGVSVGSGGMKSGAFKCLITLKYQMWIICDVVCTTIDVIFMSMRAISHVYSTFDIANIEAHKYIS